VAVVPEPNLTVAAVARRLGVAPATLRSWERRYGMGPSERTPGAHRRYTPADVAMLVRMRRLTLDGVAPAEAARGAREPTSAPTPPPEQEFHGAGATSATSATSEAAGSAAQRGLSRAALALDADAVRRLLTETVAAGGVIATWEGLLAPVLRAIGERWGSTGDGVEVEHLLAECAIGVLHTVQTDAAPPRPVLLACADGESHSLPLHAVRAALAERRVASRLLGAGLPPSALAAAVRRTGPAALLLYAHRPQHAVAGVLSAVPAMRPPTTLLAGGAGWRPDRLPARVTYVHDLGEAVHLVLVATGHA
jgi:DNA-binding transcriptional MerR regulator